MTTSDHHHSNHHTETTNNQHGYDDTNSRDAEIDSGIYKIFFKLSLFLLYK